MVVMLKSPLKTAIRLIVSNLQLILRVFRIRYHYLAFLLFRDGVQLLIQTKMYISV